jgi:acetyl esterase/lipase
MKKIFLFTIFLLAMINANAQQEILLYNGVIPGAKMPPATYREEAITGEDGILRVSKVTSPEMIAYLPEKPNGTAVIICPGGGYGYLSIDKEGKNVAKKLNEIGVAAFVLKYRLPSDLIMMDKTTGPLQDALQAMYLVRKNSSIWGINSSKIGIMGFSAGGHLAATLSVHYNDMKVQNQEQISLRPDFSVLIYPVISFGTVTHPGSVKNLLGESPTTAQKQYFSTQNYVSAQTPPAFLVHANNDVSVVPKNSILYNEALTKFKVPTEMHLYQSGGHGFGLSNDWFNSLKTWMALNKWL